MESGVCCISAVARDARIVTFLSHHAYSTNCAATLVLHTWNQELDVHPHVHALVPGSFPSLDGRRWITPKHPQHKRRRQAYLCSVVDLGGAFRKKFLIGLRRLYKQGQLKFEHEPQAEPAAFAAWLAKLAAIDWNVYIQGPPRKGAELTPPPEATATEQLPRLCPHCQAEMSSSGQSNRSSWQQVLEGPYRPDWYYAFRPGHVAAMEWYRNGY